MTALAELIARYNPMGFENLAPHLEARYGIRVSSVTRLDAGVFRVDRDDGASWVARVFPAERRVENAEGDAEVLRFLAEHGFPAERCAHADAVSTLGRLQTLPEGSGAVAREAGSLHHWSDNGGGPAEDLAAARSWLTEVEGRVPTAHRAAYDTLCDEVGRADDLHDLPQAFVNPDFQVGNAIASRDAGLVVVDWTGSGRGPRLAALATLLHMAVEGFSRSPSPCRRSPSRRCGDRRIRRARPARA